MEESILLSVKKMIGINPDYTFYDTILIADINSVFMSLNQIGLGGDKPYSITGPEETWDIIDNLDKIRNVIPLVYLKTRLMFDNIQNSFAIESYNRIIDEETWRLEEQLERSEYG